MITHANYRMIILCSRLFYIMGEGVEDEVNKG